MQKTYRAMQVARPGFLELVERDTPQPADGEVLIRVEACRRLRSGDVRFRMVLGVDARH